MPSCFYNVPVSYVKAAKAEPAKKAFAAKITVKPANKTLYIGWKENKKASVKARFTVKNYQMAFASKSLAITLEGTSDTTQKKLVLYGTQKSAEYSSSNYSSSSKLFTKKYTEEFASAYAYTMPHGASQNLWAPDIIYNTDMKKYCMYVSVVDGNTKCCIAMASSDNPDGSYKYEGIIVCSGMEADGSDIDKTNLASALGITDTQAKESKYAGLGSNSPDCIDATVFYDHNNNLWMVYGSFTTTGGIRLLKLDNQTGLRGSNYTGSGDGTDNTLSTDDPYYGKKTANSNGEGPYIQMVPNEKPPTGYYYYLWISTGNLQNYGGYNMRLMRATNPEGPYYEPKGSMGQQDI